MSLKFGLLGLLAEESLHGYQVKQRFEDMLGGTWEVNIGSVYQMLQRLERDGFVEPVGERGDRGRQAYGVTAAGSAAVEEWFAEATPQPQVLRDEIYIKMLLLDRRKDGGVDRFVDRHRHALLQRLRDLSDHEKSARRKGNLQLALLFKAGRLHTEADLKWLDAYLVELGG